MGVVAPIAMIAIAAIGTGLSIAGNIAANKATAIPVIRVTTYGV